MLVSTASGTSGRNSSKGSQRGPVPEMNAVHASLAVDSVMSCASQLSMLKTRGGRSLSVAAPFLDAFPLPLPVHTLADVTAAY